MPGPDTVVEEAPVLVGLDMALNALIVVLFLWALKTVWRYTLGAVLVGIANAVKINVWRVHLDPAGKLRTLNDLVLGELDKGIAASQNAMGFWFHQTARLQLWIADELWKGTRDAFNLGEWLVKTYVPTIAHYGAKIVFPWPTIYRVIDHEIERFLPKVGKIAHGATGATEAELAKLRRGIDRKLAEQAGLIAALGVGLGAIAGGLTWPHPGGTLTLPKGWRGLTRRLARIEARLRKMELLLGATALAAAVANMTGTRIGCWRGKGNIARALRHICGVPTWLLDVLLLGVIEGFVAADLCAFTDLLIKQAKLIRPALFTLVDVEDALIGCHGTTKPTDLALPKLSLPPMPAPSALAA